MSFNGCNDLCSCKRASPEIRLNLQLHESKIIRIDTFEVECTLIESKG